MRASLTTSPAWTRAVDSTVLAAEVLKLGHCVRIPTVGTSMYPHIRYGEVIHIQPARLSGLAIGDVAVYVAGRRMVAHRVVSKGKDEHGPFVVTKGDSFPASDAPVRPEQVLGKVVAVEKGRRRLALDTPWRRRLNQFYAWVSPLSPWTYPAAGKAKRAARFLLAFFLRRGIARHALPLQNGPGSARAQEPLVEAMAASGQNQHGGMLGT